MEFLQFHVLSFEGPDPYSRAGGLARRVDGLTRSLARLGFETHLWFIGDPERPVHEAHGSLHWHRWCQWLGRHHPGGVYHGEWSKQADFAGSLPPHLLSEHLAPHLRAGRAVVMGEEWHTAHALVHLRHLLCEKGLDERVDILWNASSAYGFEHVPWARLREAGRLTTASRRVKQRMQAMGVDAILVPSGLPHEAFEQPEAAAATALRACLAGRTLLVKEACGHEDGSWRPVLATVADLKREGTRPPLLVALGNLGPLESELRASAQSLGLRWSDDFLRGEDAARLVADLARCRKADVASAAQPVAPAVRRLLMQCADAVLVGGAEEPFSQAALEAMAVGGMAFSSHPGDSQLYRALRTEPGVDAAMRRAGRWTARRFAWHEVLQHQILPRLSAAARAAALPLLAVEAADVP